MKTKAIIVVEPGCKFCINSTKLHMIVNTTNKQKLLIQLNQKNTNAYKRSVESIGRLLSVDGFDNVII